MSIRNILAIALMAFLTPVAFVGTASAQAGAACAGTTCGLGGQIRGQIGDGLPLPISIAPAQGGEVAKVPAPFSAITIQTQPATPMGLALRGLGLGQPGQVKPTVAAIIHQTTTHLNTPNAPRKLTMPPGVFHFSAATTGSIGVAAFNSEVLAVQTNLIFDTPHPGTTGPTPNGAPGAGVVPPGGGGSRVLSKGGRPGLPTVTFCARGLDPFTTPPPATPNNPILGSPGNNFGGQCVVAADGIDAGIGVNGIVRFTKTKNQFGGISVGRTLGTAKVFFNINNLVAVQTPNGPPPDLPCNSGTNLACAFGLSTVPLATTAVAGGSFGGTVTNLSAMLTPGRFLAKLGFNGTILSFGPPTAANLPFTGQPATSVGFPLTTGMITVSVTQALPETEVFVRTGTDARTANGNGVVALNTGSMSARTTSLGNANRTWITLEIPEPSAIFAASAGLFALFGCHQLVRRRFR